MGMLKNVVNSMPTVSLEAKILWPRLGLKVGKIRGDLPSVSSAKPRGIGHVSAQWTRIVFGVTTAKRRSITRINGVQNIRRKIILRIKRTRKIQNSNRGKKDKPEQSRKQGKMIRSQ